MLIPQPGATPPPQGQQALTPLDVLEGEPEFQSLPPEMQSALLEMIQQIMETGQIPPELLGEIDQMTPGQTPPPSMPPPGMPPPGMLPPGGAMPMPPQGAMPGGPPGGGAPMPGPAMGMEEGGVVLPFEKNPQEFKKTKYIPEPHPGAPPYTEEEQGWMDFKLGRYWDEPPTSVVPGSPESLYELPPDKIESKLLRMELGPKGPYDYQRYKDLDEPDRVLGRGGEKRSKERYILDTMAEYRNPFNRDPASDGYDYHQQPGYQDLRRAHTPVPPYLSEPPSYYVPMPGPAIGMQRGGEIPTPFPGPFGPTVEAGGSYVLQDEAAPASLSVRGGEIPSPYPGPFGPQVAPYASEEGHRRAQSETTTRGGEIPDPYPGPLSMEDIHEEIALLRQKLKSKELQIRQKHALRP